MVTQQQIARFGQRLAAMFHSERIVLFGSYACITSAVLIGILALHPSQCQADGEVPEVIRDAADALIQRFAGMEMTIQAENLGGGFYSVFLVDADSHPGRIDFFYSYARHRGQLDRHCIGFESDSGQISSIRTITLAQFAGEMLKSRREGREQ